MDAIIRLFWKEFRTQLPVCVALLFGTVLIETVLVAFTKTPTADLFLGTAFVISAGFAAACAALLFSGDSEEGHADWLRQLPMTTGELVIGKVGYGIIAIFVFSTVTVTVAIVALRINGSDTSRIFTPPSVAVFSISGCYLWGLFYSVLLRRPLVVMVAAAMSALILTAMVGSARGESDLLHGLILVALAAVDLALIHRWQRGELWRARAVRAHRGSIDVQSILSAPLKWLVTRGPLEARGWTVLIWKELSGALVVTGIAMLALLSIRFLERGLPFRTMSLAGLFFTMVLFGLLSFREEQRQSVISFLSHRGISGLRVWAVKTSVWLSAAVGVTTILLAWDLVLAELTAYPGFDAPPRTVPQALFAMSPFAVSRMPFDHQSRRFELTVDFCSYVGALFMGLFLIGQVVSCWIRRTVLAVTTACLGAVVFLSWMGVIARSDVPLWGAVWPAIVAFVLAIWATRRAWMEELSGWRLRLRQAAWIVVPLLACAGFALASRGWQVPDTDPGFDWRGHAVQISALDEGWSSRWDNAVNSDARQENSRRAVQEFAESANPGRLLDPLLTMSLEDVANPGQFSISRAIQMLEGSISREANGEPRAAVQRFLLRRQLPEFRNALSGVWYLQTQAGSWSDLASCLQAEGRLLARLRAWAADPQQTEELLAESLAWLPERASDPVRPFDVRSDLIDSVRGMLKRRYVIIRSLCTGEGRIGKVIWERMSQSADSHWRLSAAGAAERKRILRLLNWTTAAELRMPLASFPELQLAKNHPDTWDVRLMDYSRYAGTTPLLPPELAQPATGQQGDLISPSQALIMKLQQCRNMTVAAVALQRYRLEHGEFPESLTALAGALPSLPQDPFSGQPFLFRRNGASAGALQHGLPSSIAEEQPVLWSAADSIWPGSLLGPLRMMKLSERMETQPARVLVLTSNEDPIDANVEWPEPPMPEQPADLPAAEGASMSPLGGFEMQPVRNAAGP